MICPECQQDTDPTQRYCEVCNAEIDPDFDSFGSQLAYDDPQAIALRGSQRAQGLLVMAVFVLILVVAVRKIVDRPVVIEHVPAYTAPAKILSKVKAEVAIEPAVRVLDFPEKKKPQKKK